MAELERLKFERNPLVATLLHSSREALRRGNRAKAYKLLQKAADVAPQDEAVWWALMEVVGTEADRVVCLENILVINPNNLEAKRLLRLANMDVTLADLTPPVPAQNFSEPPIPASIRPLPPPPRFGRLPYQTEEAAGKRLRRFLLLCLLFGLLAVGIAVTFSILLYGV